MTLQGNHCRHQYHGPTNLRVLFDSVRQAEFPITRYVRISVQLKIPKIPAGNVRNRKCPAKKPARHLRSRSFPARNVGLPFDIGKKHANKSTILHWWGFRHKFVPLRFSMIWVIELLITPHTHKHKRNGYHHHSPAYPKRVPQTVYVYIYIFIYIYI